MTDLSDIKAGDRVARLNRGHLTVEAVLRTTKTQIIIDGARFSRRTGRAIGGDRLWGVDFIAPLTPDIESRVERERDAREAARESRMLMAALHDATPGALGAARQLMRELTGLLRG